MHQKDLYYQNQMKVMTDDNNKKIHELMVQLADLKSGHANDLDEKNKNLENSIGDHRKVQQNLLNAYESQINELKQDHFKMLSDLKAEHVKKEEGFNTAQKNQNNGHN